MSEAGLRCARHREDATQASRQRHARRHSLSDPIVDPPADERSRHVEAMVEEDIAQDEAVGVFHEPMRPKFFVYEETID